MKQPKGHSAGWKKSGAYTRSECFSGSKCMPSERMKMSEGSKMSSSQVLSHEKGKHHSLEHASNVVGGDCRTFSSGIPGEAGKK